MMELIAIHAGHHDIADHKIERSMTDPQHPTATLKAHCEIDWITLQENIVSEKP